jgi:hypothetical protein
VIYFWSNHFMRNKLFLIALILPLVFGCGALDRAKKAATDTTQANSNVPALPVNVNSNKSLTDTAVEAAVGEKKTGIPECDEAMALLVAQADDPDDSFVTKAVKKTALNTFRDRVKKGLDQSNTNKKELAAFCTEFKENMVDPKTAANSNTGK